MDAIIIVWSIVFVVTIIVLSVVLSRMNIALKANTNAIHDLADGFSSRIGVVEASIVRAVTAHPNGAHPEKKGV